MKKIKFDVMLGARWQCTLTYEYCPLFPLDEQDLRKFIEEQRPTLKNKPYRIVLSINNSYHKETDIKSVGQKVKW